MRRRLLQSIFAGAGVVVGVLGFAVPTLAHADLVSSSPAPSAVLEFGPEEITLDFTERVTPVERSIEIFDQNGQPLDIGAIAVDAGDPTVVVASDLPDLFEGQFVVVWRVLSADGHVAQGAFTFQIGTGSASTDDVVSDVLAGLAADRQAPTGLEAVRHGSRFAVFAGVCALLGTLLFAVASGLSGSRLRRIIGGGWVAAMLGTAIHFATQGPYAVGGTWSGIVDLGLWGDVWSTRNGQSLVARLVLLVVFGGLLIVATGNRSRLETAWWRSSAALVGAGVIVTMSAAGHPSSSSLAGVAVGVDAAHLGAIVVWVGGLLALIAVGFAHTNQHSEDRDDQLDGDRIEYGERDVVLRFSRWATVAVPLAVVTGLWQTWHLLPSWNDLSGTAWGRALVVKISFVVAAVTIGGVARWLIVNRLEGSLRRLVLIEVAVVVAILAATTSLVANPPRVQAEARVFTASLVEGTTIVNVTVTPGRVGVNEVHLTVQTPNGALAPVVGADVRFTLDGSDTPALTVPVEVLGPNHFTGSISLLSAGSWNLEILVQVDAATITRLTTAVDIDG